MNRRAWFLSSPWLVAVALAATACGEDDSQNVSGRRQSPAVLLITLDTTRADRLGAYGSARGATPALDALAERSVVFERAYAVAPMTLPAHASLFTGRLPTRTGVRWNGEQRLPDSAADMPTLAERLRRAGYATGAFVSASVLDRAFGLDRGFERYDDAVGEAVAGPGGVWKAERPARETLSRALAWLAEQAPGRPVFLWVHLFEPHDPYLPPAPFATRFADDPYTGELAATDEALATLLEHARFRRESQAIVSVIGDHGESLGEHGEATHGILLHEATLHVPWILAAPGIPPRRLGALVSQVDLAPTLLALAGAAPLAEASALDGIDLSSAMRGAATGLHSRTLYAESLYANALYGWAPLRSTRRGSYKWVAGARGELYDFVADPGETRDLRASLPAETGALERALAEIRARERFAGAGAAAGVAVDAALAASLRSLGYLSAAAPGRESAATDDPRDRIALHERLRAIDAQGQSGDLRGAERALDELFAADPRNRLLREVVERQLRSGISQLDGGQAAVPASPSHPANPETLENAASAAALRVRLAQLVTLDGRRDEARALLEAAAQPPADRETQTVAHLSLAALALGERRFADAESRARAAIALSPRSAAAQNTLAIALDDLGRLEEAETAYRRALALDPTLYRSELNLALLLAAEPARRGEAAEHLRRFLAAAPPGDPRTPEARAFLARLSPGDAGGG